MVGMRRIIVWDASYIYCDGHPHVIQDRKHGANTAPRPFDSHAFSPRQLRCCRLCMRTTSGSRCSRRRGACMTTRPAVSLRPHLLLLPARCEEFLSSPIHRLRDFPFSVPDRGASKSRPPCMTRSFPLLGVFVLCSGALPLGHPCASLPRSPRGQWRGPSRPPPHLARYRYAAAGRLSGRVSSVCHEPRYGERREEETAKAGGAGCGAHAGAAGITAAAVTGPPPAAAGLRSTGGLETD